MNCNGDTPTWMFDVKPSVKIGFSLNWNTRLVLVRDRIMKEEKEQAEIWLMKE